MFVLLQATAFLHVDAIRLLGCMNSPVKAASSLRDSRNMMPAFAATSISSMEVIRAMMVTFPLSFWKEKLKASLDCSTGTGISAPAPLTVHLPLLYTALPARPVAPTSALVRLVTAVATGCCKGTGATAVLESALFR